MITLVLGRRELGKTTLARYLASARQRQLIVDPRAQWPDSDPYQKIDGPEIMADLDVGRPVIVQPFDLQTAVDDLAFTVQSWMIEHRGDPNLNLAIVLDEAGLYSLKAWDWIFRCSPRAHVSIILTAHRPSDISTTIRSLADTWCLFKTIQQHDLDVIADRCGNTVAVLVTKYEPFQFLSWDDATARAREHLNGAIWKESRPEPIDGTPVGVIPSARTLW